MTLFFNDLYVSTLAKGVLSPGEQLLHRVSAHHAPWWSMGIAMFQSQYLVLATSERLVLMRHKRGFLTGTRLESVDSVPWSAISTLKLGGMFAQKSLKLVANGGQTSLDLKVRGGVTEIPKNVDDGKAIASRYQQMKALPS